MSGDGDEVLYAELAGDLRRRSHRAFERIFKEMGPRLYRFAFSYLMNAEIVRMIADLSVLPWWFAEEGSCVKVENMALVSLLQKQLREVCGGSMERIKNDPVLCKLLPDNETV